MTSVDSRNDHFLYVGSHEVRGWRYRDTYIFTPGMAAPCSKSFNCNFLLGYSSFLGWGDIEAGCYGFHQSSYRRRDTGCGAGVTAVGFWTLIAPCTFSGFYQWTYQLKRRDLFSATYYFQLICHFKSIREQKVEVI